MVGLSSSRFYTVILLLTLHGLFATGAHAQLAVLKYQEKYAENIEQVTDENGTTCAIAQNGRFKLFAMTGSSENQANYGPETQVTLTFGNYVFTAQLKDDPNYQSGDTQARITHFGPQPIGKKAPVSEVLSLNWGNSQLSASVKANIALVGNAYAEDAATGPITVHYDLDLSNGGISFTHISFNADGSAKSSSKTKPSPCDGDVNLRKVQLKASRKN